MAKYEEYIMENLRQRRGLEADDDSQDNRIENMSKARIIKEYLSWEGLIGYGDMIIDLINDVYGIDLYSYDEE